MNLKDGRSASKVSKNDIEDFLVEKTGMSLTHVQLFLEAFVFFVKKELYEKGEFQFIGFGKFLLKPKSIKRHGVSFSSIRFSAFKTFKDKMKGNYPEKEFRRFFKRDFVDSVRKISKMFGMKYSEAKYIIVLIVDSIIVCLLKNKEVKIPKLGRFELQDNKGLVNTCISKKYEIKDVNTLVLKFTMVDSCFREINKKTKLFFVSERFKRMLYLSGVDRDITLRKF